MKNQLAVGTLILMIFSGSSQAGSVQFADEQLSLFDYSNSEVTFSGPINYPINSFNPDQIGLYFINNASFTATFSQPVISVALNLFTFGNIGPRYSIDPATVTAVYGGGEYPGQVVGFDSKTAGFASTVDNRWLGGLFEGANATPFESVTFHIVGNRTFFDDPGNDECEGGCPVRIFREGPTELGSSFFSYTFAKDTPPVPEPETFSMIAVGLGFLGLVARRRSIRDRTPAKI